MKLKCLCNKKGQAILESLVVMMTMIFIFFALMLVSTYIFDRMVVLYAANAAINEGIAYAPEKGATPSKVKRRMEGRAAEVLKLGIFLKNTGVRGRVSQDPQNKQLFDMSIVVQGTYQVSLPLVSDLLNSDTIRYSQEVKYVW